MVTSSTESEFITAELAAKIAKYLRSILIELGFPPSVPTMLYEDDKAAINMVNVNRVLGTSTFNTLRFKNGDSAATSSSRISLVSSTQRTLRPSHSVGFYITDTFAAFGTTMDRALFELTFSKGYSQRLLGTREQPAVCAAFVFND